MLGPCPAAALAPALAPALASTLAPARHLSGRCPGPCPSPAPAPALALALSLGPALAGAEGGGGRKGDLALGGGRVGRPWPGNVIPDFTLPDTLEKNFVRDLASNFSK